ncbi:hypothetical protein LUZ61_008522 [Rhynchospora tenuis]|uniref:Ionotropic glutamate receptor C-terminal domain-containing protein n=1 Tax=Rhynchospora tenuis TaxID=198213 RepID=A0AAD6EXJ1_9POAL|nr:hypothetical protein LUZ61_008522 [Rhynchospora tenuis]
MKTQAIVGPQKSSQAVMVSEIGCKCQVPVISFSASSPTLSSMDMPYFVRTTINDAAQVYTIATLIKAYGWREVVPVYEDTDFGRDIIPYLADALQEIDVRIPYRSLINESSTNDQIQKELYKLQTMQTRVFIVHMTPSRGSTLFLNAQEVGMMSKGYVWIMTNGITNVIDSLDPSVTSAMKGIVGVRPHVPKSKKLEKFATMWRKRFQEDNPSDKPCEVSAIALWAYDTIHALVLAVEKVGVQKTKLQKNSKQFPTSSFEHLPVFSNGPQLLKTISHIQYRAFVKVETDPVTNAVTVSGLSVDVFEAAIKRLPYAVSYEYEYVGLGSKANSMSYNDLVYQIYLKNYDVAIGDITMTYNRTLYVDFSVPYTESGVAMIVPVKEAVNRNTLIFLRPLTVQLWLASLAFFIYTGIVILILEPKLRSSLGGSITGHFGTIVHLSVFAYQEKLESILSKIVVLVWYFVLLVLTSSYTASLSSMLTVQQLQPTVADVHDLINNGDYVGYHRGSFVEGLLQQLNFDKSKIRSYNSDNYEEAIMKGSANGGVAAMVDEIPYIKLFLAKHCKSYTMVEIYRSAGFGFAFPKGSPLVPDISRAIINITNGDDMIQMEKKWIGEQNCQNNGNIIGSNNLSFVSFWGIFLMTGVVSTVSLLISVIISLCKKWRERNNVMSTETNSDESNAFEVMPNMSTETYSDESNAFEAMSNMNQEDQEGEIVRPSTEAISSPLSPLLSVASSPSPLSCLTFSLHLSYFTFCIFYLSDGLKPSPTKPHDRCRLSWLIDLRLHLRQVSASPLATSPPQSTFPISPPPAKRFEKSCLAAYLSRLTSYSHGTIIRISWHKAHEFEQLADEVRAEIAYTVSKTRGHLSSSLGVVELSVAIIHAFNTLEDKIIWDVGHQAYTHKILTGRRSRINTIRQISGLTGFPKRDESIYDAFGEFGFSIGCKSSPVMMMRRFTTTQI